MAYTLATKLPDRYKVVFRNATKARIRHALSEAEYNRKDRDQYVLNAYAPTGRGWETFDYWFVPFIETFDTPSGDLEDGMVWEGVDKRGVSRIMWKPVGGGFESANSDEVTVSRSGDAPDVIARKPS